MLDEQAWLKLLTTKLRNSQFDLQLLDEYYRGEQPLSFMSPEMIAEFGERVRPLVFGWPALVVDTAEERLDVEGFRLAGQDEADDNLWRIWQANNLDEASQMCTVDAMVNGRSFVIVGTNPDDEETPKITVESPLQVAASWDPQTRLVRAAVKQWKDLEDGKTNKATLYLPDSTVWFEMQSRKWVESDRDNHGLGQVPVIPLVNRPATLVPEGVSEISKTIKALTDAANKTGTDMMTSVEFHGMPRRWVMGLSEKDFTDEQGRPLSTWSSVAGRIWGIENPDAQVGQFDEAALSNFHETIRLLAEQLAALGCLPPAYVGLLAQANPASADAIRAMESRLIRRVERKQRAFGGAWETVMRTALLWTTGQADPSLVGMETIWADASTPTVAEKADAAVKLNAGGIVPLEQTWEDLGYTATQIQRMKGQRAEEQTTKDASLAGLLNPQFQAPGEPTPNAA